MSNNPSPQKDFPWLKSYPVDIDWHAEIPSTTLTALFDESIKKYPDQPCLNFLGTKMTYREVGEAVDTFAKALQDKGIGPGTTVGLALPNTPYYVIAYYAAMKVGARLANFNPIYPSDAMKHQINDSKTDVMITVNVKEVQTTVDSMLGQTCLKKVIVCDLSEAMPAGKKRALRAINPLKAKIFDKMSARHKARVDAKAEGREVKLSFFAKLDEKLFKVFNNLPSLLKVREDENHFSFSKMMKTKGKPSPVEINPQDTALLQYTGGTTGPAKGAELTHINLSSNIVQANMWFTGGNDAPEKEKVLVILPFFHVFSMTVQMNLTLSRGGELVMLPKFNAVETLKTMDKEKPTMFAGIPQLYKALIDHPDVKKYDLSSLKICLSGGAALTEPVRKGWKELTGIDIVEGYGLSETSPIVLANPLHGEKKSASIGLPLPATEVKIEDLETPGKAQGVKENGEICVRGPQIMRGYFNNAAETAKVIDKDGFFHTGDVGYMDEEGYVFIVDRLKDMINVTGMKVFSLNVENAILKHPAVSETCVIAVPNDRSGEAVKAFIAFKPGQEVSQQELVSFLKDKLPPYALPTVFDIRAELPKTLIGKPDKKALKDEEKAKREKSANAPKP